jgi:hypothetical protein
MHGANFFYRQTAVFLESESPRPCVPRPTPGHGTGGRTVHLRAYAGPFLMIYAARAFVGLCRVGRIVDLAEVVDGDVGVDLRRVQILMTKQRLNAPQVRSVLQHQRRCRVTEDVARTPLVDPCGFDVRPHQ